MKTIAVLITFCAALAGQTPPGERHEFVIHDFRTESGVTLPEVRVVYGTYGKLNADKSNAILMPSHYMANYRGYTWLIGPGRALNPDGLYLICTELFGNGSSSSPSNATSVPQASLLTDLQNPLSSPISKPSPKRAPNVSADMLGCSGAPFMRSFIAHEWVVKGAKTCQFVPINAPKRAKMWQKVAT